MTKTEKFKIEILLQMAKITDNSVKKSEYLNLIENLLSENTADIPSIEMNEEDFFTKNDPTEKAIDTYYNECLLFCNENGIKAETKNYLGRCVRERFNVQSEPKTVGGKSIRVYKKVM